MRCKKSEVILKLHTEVESFDCKGKKIKRGKAEDYLEKMLGDVFKLYLQSFGKKISIEFPNTVKVLPDVSEVSE